MKLYNYHKYNESKHNDIYSICKKYYIKNYTVNEDGSIDVDGDVDISHSMRERIPLKFNHVSGHFRCDSNYLHSLIGCPSYVGGNFSFRNNYLSTLDGCPETVVGYFNSQNNFIKDFKGFPEFYEGDVYFFKNPVYAVLIHIGLDKHCKFIHLLNEYDVIRNGKTIIRDRLEAAYEGIGLELPENITIKGYEII